MKPTALKPPNPHDEFTKNVFQELPHARGLFRGYLPKEVSALCVWRTLKLESSSFSNDELGREFADLLFSVELKGLHRHQRIRLLFEHKRRPDKETARQLQRYIHQQFEQTPAGNALPCIITVLLLQHGRCSHPTLSSEYQLPEAVRQVLAPYMLDFRMITIELSQLAESDLHGTEAGRFALALLKTVGEGNPIGWSSFRATLKDLCGHLSPKQCRRELRRAFVYLLSVIQPEQEQEVRQALESAKTEFEPVQEHVMTLLEHLQQRGEQLGLQRGERLGELRGRIEMLSEWLASAFPEFGDEDAARLNELSADGLTEVKTALREHQSWTAIRKLIRSSRLKNPSSARTKTK